MRGRWGEIVVYRCELIGPATDPRVSDAHSEVRFLDASTIPDAELPAGYREAITRALSAQTARDRT